MMPNSEEKYPTSWNIFVANFVLFQVHYSLVSIISHIGKKAYGGKFYDTLVTAHLSEDQPPELCLSSPGHYICEGLYHEADQGDVTDCWLTFDDERVSKTTSEDVCRRRQKSAYLLFYQRREWLPDLAQKHKNGGKCWCSVWKKNGHHLSAIYS